MTGEVTHIIHSLANPPPLSLPGQGEPKIQVPHQPECYNHIICYVQKGAQITQIARLEACNIYFPCIYLLRRRFLLIPPVCTQFPYQIPSTRWTKKRSLLSNKTEFGVLCKIKKKLQTLVRHNYIRHCSFLKLDSYTHKSLKSVTECLILVIY